MQSTRSVDLIGQVKFLLWRQLIDRSVSRYFLAAKGVAYEITLVSLVPRPSQFASLLGPPGLYAEGATL